MTSRWPYWCTKNATAAMLVNRKKILWRFNSFICKKNSFLQEICIAEDLVSAQKRSVSPKSLI